MYHALLVYYMANWSLSGQNFAIRTAGMNHSQINFVKFLLRNVEQKKTAFNLAEILVKLKSGLKNASIC